MAVRGKRIDGHTTFYLWARFASLLNYVPMTYKRGCRAQKENFPLNLLTALGLLLSFTDSSTDKAMTNSIQWWTQTPSLMV